MKSIQKSALFKKQLIDFVRDYNQRAGSEVAEKFIDAVERSVEFIQQKPMACAIYTESSKHLILQKYEFRKWRIDGFPHSIFFRILNENTIMLEAVYAHRMNVPYRIQSDMDQ